MVPLKAGASPVGHLGSEDEQQSHWPVTPETVGAAPIGTAISGMLPPMAKASALNRMTLGSIPRHPTIHLSPSVNRQTTVLLSRNSLGSSPSGLILGV